MSRRRLIQPTPTGAYLYRQTPSATALPPFEAASRRFGEWRVQGPNGRGWTLEMALHGRGAVARAGEDDLQDLQDRLSLSLRRHGLRRRIAMRMLSVLVRRMELLNGRLPRLREIAAAWTMARGGAVELPALSARRDALALGAALAALAGARVHLLSESDEATRTLAEAIQPCLQGLGLPCGIVLSDMDEEARRAGYEARITFVPARQAAADHLRDRVMLGPRTERLRQAVSHTAAQGAAERPLIRGGLDFAFVEDADRLLIREATANLAVSDSAGLSPQARLRGAAVMAARQMEPDLDFTADPERKAVQLTDEGKARLAGMRGRPGNTEADSAQAERLLLDAIAAVHLCRRDEDYTVRNGQIVIAAAQPHLRPLIPLLEAAERNYGERQEETMARLSLYRFFTRYLGLAAISPALAQDSGELWSMYRLRTSVMGNLPERGIRGAGTIIAGDRLDLAAAVLRWVAARRELGETAILLCGDAELSEILAEALSGPDFADLRAGGARAATANRPIRLTGYGAAAMRTAWPADGDGARGIALALIEPPGPAGELHRILDLAGDCGGPVLVRGFTSRESVPLASDRRPATRFLAFLARLTGSPGLGYRAYRRAADHAAAEARRQRYSARRSEEGMGNILAFAGRHE